MQQAQPKDSSSSVHETSKMTRRSKRNATNNLSSKSLIISGTYTHFDRLGNQTGQSSKIGKSPNIYAASSGIDITLHGRVLSLKQTPTMLRRSVRRSTPSATNYATRFDSYVTSYERQSFECTILVDCKNPDMKGSSRILQRQCFQCILLRNILYLEEINLRHKQVNK